MVFAGVAEWQTRRLQVPVVARLCGFKSHLLHTYQRTAFQIGKLFFVRYAQQAAVSPA